MESSDDAFMPALVGDIGRTAIRLGLTDGRGRLRHETIRSYQSADHSTVSGAISNFEREWHLPAQPRRCALAVSEPILGDTISITGSRWFVSRSGLAAMLRTSPIILNDFAANAWALSAPEYAGDIEHVEGPKLAPSKPGTYCIVGVGSGLGVAVLNRDEHRRVNVVATGAGRCGFMAGLPEFNFGFEWLRAHNKELPSKPSRPNRVWSTCIARCWTVREDPPTAVPRRVTKRPVAPVGAPEKL